MFRFRNMMVALSAGWGLGLRGGMNVDRVTRPRLHARGATRPQDADEETHCEGPNRPGKDNK